MTAPEATLVEPSVSPPSTEPTEQATALRVNSAITPRPGVPTALALLDWWTDTDAGEFGTTAQLRVPSDEYVLSATGGRVISVRDLDGGQTDNRPQEIVVREIRTGSLVLEVPTAMRGVSAVLVGDRLFWTGTIPAPFDASGNPTGRDGGIWTIGLTDVGAEPRAIVAPATAAVELGLGGRAPIQVSSTGRTLATSFVWIGGQSTDVVDTQRLEVRAHLAGVVALAVTDVIVVAHTGPRCDCPTGGVAGIDIGTKARRWAIPKDGDVDRLALQVRPVGSELILEYGTGPNVFEGGSIETKALGLVDPSTGRLETLWSSQANASPMLTVIPQLMTPAAIGVATEGTMDSIISDHVSISVLDPETKVLTQDVFTIDSAW